MSAAGVRVIVGTTVGKYAIKIARPRPPLSLRSAFGTFPIHKNTPQYLTLPNDVTWVESR